MAEITGSRTNLIMKIGSTFGTAVSGGAGNKIPFRSLSRSLNPSALENAPLGLGKSMLTDSRRGNLVPQLSIDMVAGFRNSMDVMLAQMMGTSAVPTEVTAAQGDYKHTIKFSDTRNAKWITCAFDATTTEVFEYPSCAVTRVNIKADAPASYLNFSADLLANEEKIASTTNTNASLASATLTDDEEAVVQTTSTFRLNLQSGGALAGGDKVEITSLDFELSIPQNPIFEIKGASGNSEPRVGGLLEGTVKITFAELASFTYFTAAAADTAYKMDFEVTGSTIAAGTAKSIKIIIPRAKIVEDIDFGVNDPGNNAPTVTLKILNASANPTGMTDTYPYFEIVNTLATSLLA